MKKIFAFFCFCVVSLFACTVASAQSVGSISGSVLDSSGAVIAGSDVTLVNQGTNATRHTIADSAGLFYFTTLPIGTYVVTAKHAGFQTTEIRNTVLEGQKSVRLDIKLSAESVSTSVEVTIESASEVQRADASLGQTIHSEQVAELPLNGRDFAQLALLTPGTTKGEQTTDFLNKGTSSEVSFRGSVSLSVQGMAENTNDWRLDGVDDNELTGGGVGFLPQVDAIQEFNVLTYNYSAQYGSRGGSTVLVSTKSGSNQLHGSLFEFLRNDVLDARNYFDPIKKGKYRQNEFGGSLGGPIFKDKIFFFVDYQGNRIRQGKPVLSIVPTDAQRINHVFTNPIFNPVPSIGQPNANARTSYYNSDPSGHPNMYYIPSSQISSIGQAILNLYPTALPVGTPGLTGAYNYTASPTGVLNDDEFDVRVDHQLSQADHIFARFSWDNGTQFNPSGLPGFGSVSSYTSTTNFTTHARNMALSETHVFSPHIVNQIAIGYNRDFNFIRGLGYGTNAATQIGISGANLGDAATSGMTLISLTGFNPIGDRLYSPYQGGTNVFHYFDSLSVIKGKHNVVFGFDYRPMQMNSLGETYFHGQMAFTKNFTAKSPTSTFAGTYPDPVSGITGANGSPVASLLLGYPDTANRTNQVNSGIIGRRWKEYRGYAQDNWTISPTFTLNIGVAYGYVTPLTEAASRISNFDITTGKFFVTGSQASAYSGTIASDKYAGIHPDYSNIEPRISFAASPFGTEHSTVIRGGYGIFHDTSHLGQSTGINQNPPYANTFSAPTDDITPKRTLIPGSPINGFPDNSQPQNPSTYNGSLVAMDRNFKQGIVQQYNLNIQQKAAGTVLTVAYAGTHATRLFDNISAWNGALPGAGNNGVVTVGGVQTTTRRPYNNLNSIAYITSNGWLTYNSLQLKAERRVRDFYMLAAYTYSQALTNGYSEAVTTLPGSTYYPLTSSLYANTSIPVSQGTPAGSSIANPSEPLTAYADRGHSSLDLRSNFTASVLYQLPFGKGKKFFSSTGRVTDEVIGGWQANTIITSHTGFPMAFTQATNTAGTGVTNRPDLTTGCDLYAGAKTVGHWFNTSCFTAPTAQQLGNAPRTVGYGPGRTNVDFSLYKKFAIVNTQNLEFRAEFFNLFNHSQFGMPDQALGDAAFGSIATTVHENRQIQFALKYMF